MAQVRNEERITPITALSDQLVHRAWDLGVKDDTSIWWFQRVGAQVFILDHLAQSGVGLDYYLAEIEARELKYRWKRGNDYVPHDAKIREWGSGKTRVETMIELGLKPMLVPSATMQDGINAVRRLLPLCVFDPRCEDGINALEQYRREWDDDKKAFRANAVHDWTSHPADSFRYLALARKQASLREVKPVNRPQGIIIPPPPEPRRGGIIL
jgi:hypothetical protein